jgi:hypothetical protein
VVDYGHGIDGSTLTFEVTKKGDYGTFEPIFNLNQVLYDNGEVEYDLETAPFADEYFWFEGYGIHYEANGNMNPRHNIKGLPLKIDMDATVNLFLQQVLNRDFSDPVLVKPKK